MAVPAGVLVNWDLTKCTPSQLEEDTVKLLAELQQRIDNIGAIPLQQATYHNVVQPLDALNRDLRTNGAILDMPQHCVEDKLVRDASSKAEEKMEEFDVAVNMRADVFERILHVQETGMDELGAEQKRFVNKLIVKGKRYGLHLSSDVQQQIKELKTKESKLAIKFSSNLNEDDTKLYFTKEQLVGLPHDIMNELCVGSDGKLEVTIKYNHLFPVMKNCTNPETRKAMVTAANRKCMKENTPILEELIELRHLLATILCFPTHAAFILDDRMAKTPDTVATFLTDLQGKLGELVEQEKAVMLAYKEEECKESGLECNGELDLWDMRYYMDMVEKKKYAVDHNVLREYFPMPRVLTGMFDVYQQLLSVKFDKVDNPPVWHKDVLMYKVNDTDSGELMGYFFLDLHPRAGKYSHAAVFGLQQHCKLEDASTQVAVCAMLCNFSMPTADKPALLEHSEVETLFHEFGHVMHHICSRAEVALFSGTSVSRDFIEAPSQMLENWVWEKEPLALMSEHYKSKEPIPDELLLKLAASRAANAGMVNMRQVALSSFDQAIHTQQSADTASEYARIHKQITGFAAIPDTNMPASFGHLGGGYDAQYYGYLWSEVFSMDMFETRFSGKVMDGKVGREYRDIILARGNSIDAKDILVQFLGREPNNKAFLRSKGLKC
uniref:Thimet oligopeptidase-like n=1 Tax=Hirondellea gigas TaxID=1518452 RepID=A0A2P2HXB7_9CRUS